MSRLRLSRQKRLCDFVREAAFAGKSIIASNAVIANNTSKSTKVNAVFPDE